MVLESFEYNIYILYNLELVLYQYIDFLLLYLVFFYAFSNLKQHILQTTFFRRREGYVKIESWKLHQTFRRSYPYIDLCFL